MAYGTAWLLFSWIVYQSKRFRAWGLIMRLNCAYVGYVRNYVCEEPPTLSMMVPYFPYKDLFLFCSSSTWNRRHSSCKSHESLTPFSHVILKLKWWGLSVRARNLRQLMTISHLIFYSNYGKIRERNYLNGSKRLIIHFMVDRNSMNQSLKIYWYYLAPLVQTY